MPIYTDVTAIVSGSVNGRVTVGAGQDIVVADNIAPVTPGDDVIGLVAYSDLWVAEYAPDQLDWTASVLVADEHLAHRGQQPSERQRHDVHRLGRDGHGRQLRVRPPIYAYDPNLQYLPPPWFPAVDDTLTTTFFREVKP